MNTVIYGLGVVGRAMRELFPDSGIHDTAKGFHWLDAHRDDLAVVCVPTESTAYGACDTSIVEDTVHSTPCEYVLIKSTVPPGTTARLALETGKHIVFSPEFLSESKYWVPPQFPQPGDARSHGFVILGGSPEDCSVVADVLLPVLGPATRFRFMRSDEAELVKYASNAFGALKVTFANDLRRICEAAKVNYHTVREGWIDDPRVGPMHTAAFVNARGFSGKCLPKDTLALQRFCNSLNLRLPLLDSVLEANQSYLRVA